MRLIQKILDLKRLDFTRSVNVLELLFRKKLGKELSEMELQELEFFDCLRLADGFITKKDSLKIRVSLKGIYNSYIDLRVSDESSDIFVFKQVVGWEEYHSVVKAFKDNFHTDATSIIDAGANIGLTSLYFSVHFPEAAIVSIEPSAENFDLLKTNLSQQNVTCIQGAVWSMNCSLKLVNDFRDKLSWSCRVEETEDTTGSLIPAFNIMYIKENKNFDCIDILKMDIEGAEKEIFSHGSLEFLNNTKCIALEIHDEFNCRNDIYQCLTDHGFTYFNSRELTIGINKKFIS